MKHNLLYTIFFTAVATGMILVSCTKKIDDAYANPNATVRVPVESLMPGVIGNFVGSSSAAGSSYGLGGDALMIGRYLQYWGTNVTGSTAAQYDQMGGTTGTSDVLGSVWGAVYYGQGQNLNKIIEWGSEEQKWDYVGAALAIRAWGWLELTNEYGDVILKDAFNTSQQQFHYDTQPEVYDTVRQTCYRALAYLNRTDGAVSQKNLAIGDQYFYKGDVNKWKKFVYGILARSYHYLTNKSDYKPDSVIYYTNLAMTSNDDNATCKFANSGISGTANYFGILRANVGSIRQAAYITNLMSGTNSTAFIGVTDPRIWYMLRENPNGTFRGITPWMGSSSLVTADQPNNFWGGLYATTVAPATEVNGRYIFRNDAEFPIMTAAEMQLIKAEAAYRKNDMGTALAAYKNGIMLNLTMLRDKYSVNVPVQKYLSDSAINAYMGNPAVVPSDAGNLTLTHILLQKYIALFGHGVQETWADMRRFHYIDSVALPIRGMQRVYPDFVTPRDAMVNALFANNNGKLVYRARPRYNSEYIYDVPELRRIGALNLDYHTYECWFSQK